MSKVLVFGVTGEIGSRVARACAAAGHEVVGVSRGRNPLPHVALDGVRLLKGDKTNDAFVAELSAGQRFDTVIDTVPTLEDMQRYHRYFHGVENMVTCSSTGTFVPLQACPADEDHPWREQTPANGPWYPQCIRDTWALDRAAEDGFPISILRPTNIIGAGRVPLDLWGGRSLDFWKMLRNSEPLAVPLGYDRVLVQPGCNEDLASAFAKTVGLGKAIHGQLFIISCRRAITLKRYLEAAMEFLESRSPIEVVAPEQLQVQYGDRVSRGGLDFLLEHMCFSIEKAQRLLRYDPLYSAERGLVQTLRWCKEKGLFCSIPLTE